jgi:DNA mismatch endonuclease, patch repair protein
MAGIRGKNTKPEVLVRSFLHRNGFRFRLHTRHLPGRPDLVLPKYRTVIFVHGCFWHRHPRCPLAYAPRSNSRFWKTKLDGNVLRDKRQQQELRKAGWKVRMIWECEINDRHLRRLVNALRRTSTANLSDGRPSRRLAFSRS